MNIIDISALATKASTVAAQSADLTEAYKEESAAREAVLVAVLTAVRPALRALCSRIVTAHSVTGLGTDKQRETRERYELRGLYLGEGQPGPVRDCPRDNGAYEGTDRFLLENGSLLTLTYSGTWSKWQGSSGSWESEANVAVYGGSAPTIVASELVELGADESAIQAISAALDRQIAGKAPDKARAARARAEKLRAVAALMGAK